MLAVADADRAARARRPARLVSVLGPFGVGALYDATDGWRAPLLLLIGICVPQLLVGLYASRPRFVEDELESRAAARTSGDW